MKPLEDISKNLGLGSSSQMDAADLDNPGCVCMWVQGSIRPMVVQQTVPNPVRFSIDAITEIQVIGGGRLKQEAQIR
jgi:N-acetyl-gamma-glutamylphosphate reductase